MAAADKAFEVIEADSAAPEGGSTTVVARGADIVFDGLGVTSRGGVAPSRLSAVASPGAITVLTGPNGCGKSTAVHALLGLIEPSSGRVTVAGAMSETWTSTRGGVSWPGYRNIRSSCPAPFARTSISPGLSSRRRWLVPRPRRDSTRYWLSCCGRRDRDRRRRHWSVVGAAAAPSTDTRACLGPRSSCPGRTHRSPRLGFGRDSVGFSESTGGAWRHRGRDRPPSECACRS